MVYIATFLLGISARFNILSSIRPMIFIVFYGIVKFSFEDRKIMPIITKFKNLGLVVYVPLMSFVVGTVLYFSAQSFKFLLAQRSTAGEENRIIQALKNLPDFLPEWFNAVFITWGAAYMVLAIFFCVAYILWYIHKHCVADKKKQSEQLFYLCLLC